MLSTGNVGCDVYKATKISLTVGTTVKVTGFSAIITLALRFLFSIGTFSKSIGIYFPFRAVLFKDLLNIRAVVYEKSMQTSIGV